MELWPRNCDRETPGAGWIDYNQRLIVLRNSSKSCVRYWTGRCGGTRSTSHVPAACSSLRRSRAAFSAS